MIIFTITDAYDEIDRQVFDNENEAAMILKKEYQDVVQEDSYFLEDILSDLMLAYPDTNFDIIDMGDGVEDSEEDL